MTFSCHIFLGPFGLRQFLRLSLSLKPGWPCRGQVRSFAERPGSASVCVRSQFDLGCGFG